MFDATRNAVRDQSAVACDNDQALKGEVAKLRQLAQNARTAADEVSRAVSRLEDINLAARSREICAAKQASL